MSNCSILPIVSIVFYCLSIVRLLFQLWHSIRGTRCSLMEKFDAKVKKKPVKLAIGENRTEKSHLKQILWHFLWRPCFDGTSAKKMLISAFWATSCQLFSNFFLRSRHFTKYKYYLHAKFQINWTIQTEITEGEGAESALPRPYQSAKSPACLGLTLCSHYIGLIFGPVRKPIRYNVNDARGNRSGPVRLGVELFTPYRIDMFWIGNIRFKSNLVSGPREW